MSSTVSVPAQDGRRGLASLRPDISRPSAGAFALAAIVAVAAVIRFWGLGAQGFWFDEGNTALLVARGAGNMLGLIPHTESTPPLYYCVAWVWVRVFGDHEAGLRSLSALCGVLTVPTAHAAARELVSRRAGLFVAALTACNPLLIWYSQEARSYALLVLLTTLSLWAFARLSQDPTRRTAVLWALAAALALLTHYYAIVALVPQAAWLLARHGRRRTVQMAIAAVVLVGLALVPLAVAQNGTGRDSWIAHAPLGLRLRQILPLFLIGPVAPAREALKFAALALAGLCLVLLAWRTPAPERRGALVGAGLALGGFAVSLLAVAAGKDTLLTRNLLPLWPPAAIAVGSGLAAPRPRWVGMTLALGLCGVGLTAAIGVAADHDLQRPDWRLVAAALGPAPPDGRARLILVQHYQTLLPLSLYLPHLHFLGRHRALRVGELDVISMSDPPSSGFCWWGSACNLVPSAMQRRYAIAGLHPAGRRQVRRFTILRMLAARPVIVTRHEVARALRTTHLARDGLLIQRPAAG